MNKKTILETPSRVYYITSDNGIFDAHFQPVNPKTGKPWQASRHLSGGNCYRTGKYGEPGCDIILADKEPAYGTAAAAGCDWTHFGWNSEELAVTEAMAHARKSGLLTA